MINYWGYKMKKKLLLIPFILVFFLLTSSGIFAKDSNIFYQFLKDKEEHFIGLEKNPSNVHIIRGSADYTWNVFQNVITGREKVYSNQIKLSESMENEIQSEMINLYKDVDSNNNDPLIYHRGEDENEEIFFMSDALDVIDKVFDKEIIKQQQLQKQNYQLPTSKYYWKTIVKPEWDTISKVGNFIKVKKGNNYRLFDLEGKMVFDTKFTDFILIDNYTVLGSRNNGNKKDVVGTDGKLLFELPINSSISDFIGGRAVVFTPGDTDYWGNETVASKAGVIDTKGKFIIPMAYYDLNSIYNDKNQVIAYIAEKRVGKKLCMGMIDKNGKTIIPLQYDTLRYINNTLIAAEKNNKWGCIDFSGKTIIPFAYEDMPVFKDGIGIVKKAKKYGVINSKGKVISPAIYDYISEFKGGKAVVSKGKKTGVFDNTGKILVPINYSWIDIREDGLYLFIQNGKYGLLNQQGKMIAKPEWDQILSRKYCNEIGMSTVIKDKKYGYMDATGKLIIPAKYYQDYVKGELGFDFYDGIALMADANGKYGYITKAGEIISEPQWDKSGDASNGYIKICKNGKYGFIDYNGNIVIQPKWDFAGDFDEAGYVNVANFDYGSYESSIIDSNGMIIVSTKDMKDEFQNIGLNPNQEMRFVTTFIEDLAILQVKGKFYYVNKAGKMPFLGSYTLAQPFKNGLATVYDGRTYFQFFSIYGSEPEDVYETYVDVLQIPMVRRRSPAGSFHLIDKKGMVLLSYPKESWTGKIYSDENAEMFKPFEWNESQELQSNLLRSIVYDKKEGLMVLKKK